MTRLEMLRTQTDPSLCALAQAAPRSQAILVSGPDYAAAQATGRQPDDLCHWQRSAHQPDHAPSRCRLPKPKSFRPSLALQNVQTPGRGRQSAHYYPAAQFQPTAVGNYSSEVRIANLLGRGIFPAPGSPHPPSRIPLQNPKPAAAICPKLRHEKMGRNGPVLGALSTTCVNLRVFVPQ